MATVLVMGATRGIGRETVDSLLKAGHAVRAMARSDFKAPPADPNFTVVQGDALDPDAVRRALEGVDAVIQTLGVPLDVKMFTTPTTLFSRATAILIEAMEEHGPRRLITVTGFGAGDCRSAMSTLERIGHDAMLGRVYPDKGVQEAAIKASKLDWTILRPGILTNGLRSGDYKVLAEPSQWRNGLISRGDVGDYAAGIVEDASTYRTEPVLVY